MSKKRQVMICKTDCRARAFVVLPRVAAIVFAIAIATNNIRKPDNLMHNINSLKRNKCNKMQMMIRLVAVASRGPGMLARFVTIAATAAYSAATNNTDSEVATRHEPAGDHMRWHVLDALVLLVPCAMKYDGQGPLCDGLVPLCDGLGPLSQTHATRQAAPSHAQRRRCALAAAPQPARHTRARTAPAPARPRRPPFRIQSFRPVRNHRRLEALATSPRGAYQIGNTPSSSDFGGYPVRLVRNHRRPVI